MAKKDTSALRPEVFTVKGYIDQPKGIEELTVEEKILALGADNQFWTILKKHFENEIQALEQINDAAIASGMALDEIGRNAIVINQVKGVLKRIINTVVDAKEAQDARGNGK